MKGVVRIACCVNKWVPMNDRLYGDRSRTVVVRIS